MCTYHIGIYQIGSTESSIIKILRIYFVLQEYVCTSNTSRWTAAITWQLLRCVCMHWLLYSSSCTCDCYQGMQYYVEKLLSYLYTGFLVTNSNCNQQVICKICSGHIIYIFLCLIIATGCHQCRQIWRPDFIQLKKHR